MRRIAVHMQVTLDNRISRPDGLFWEPFSYGEEETTYVNQIFAAADTWVLSRKLYEFVVPYWEQVAAGTAPDLGIPDDPSRKEFARILGGLTKVVFSSTLADDPSTRRVVRSGDLAQHLHDLKEQNGPDLIASFGPRTLGPLADVPGLIDEYLLVVHPAVITAGPRLFEHATRNLGFNLVDSRVFDSGAAIMRYRVSEEGAS